MKHTKWKNAVSRSARLIYEGARYFPFWVALLVIAAMLFKLDYLNDRLDVGVMNHWKWEVNWGALLLATFWTAFLGPRARIVSLLLVDALLSAVVLSDLVYFRYFKDFITVPVLLQAGQVSALQDSISDLIIYKDIIYFIDLPFLLLLAIWVIRRNSGKRKPVYPGTRRVRLSIRLLVGIVVFAIGYQLIAGPVAEQKRGWAAGLFEGNWWNVPIYNVAGLFGFHGYDVYRYAKENWLGGGVTAEQIQEARDWMNDRKELQIQSEAEPLFGAYKGKNVLIVQAEAFNAFLIGLTVGGEEVTPNLNQLIGQSVYFPNFYHQTANGRTSDADFTTSCSLHPVSSGSVFIRFASHDFECMPEVLGDAGYDTTVHHAYDGSFWNRNNMYHNMEYGQFYNIKDFKMDEPLGWSLGDVSFFRQTVQQIQDRGNYPFYAMAISLSSHHPYAIGKHSLNVGALSGTILGDYVQAAHYVDEAVGELVEDLKAANLWDDTILMFYGDHDNSISDWDAYETLFGRPVTDLEKDSLLKKVPFFIHLPNDEYAGVREKAVGQLDTETTVLHLLGISTAPYSLMGVSAMSDVPKPVVFRNGGFTDGSVFFAPNNEGILGHGNCYSLPDGAAQDPSVCLPGATQAREELAVSDRIVEHDLVPLLKEVAVKQ